MGEDAALLVDLPQTYLSLLEQAVSAQVTASFENGSLDGGPQVTAFHFQMADRWVYALYCFQWEYPCAWWGDTVYVHVTPYGQGDLVGGGLPLRPEPIRRKNLQHRPGGLLSGRNAGTIKMHPRTSTVEAAISRPHGARGCIFILAQDQ